MALEVMSTLKDDVEFFCISTACLSLVVAWGSFMFVAFRYES